MKKKLRSCLGETLGETLAALLIGALALVMLPGAIVAAAKVNAAAENGTKDIYSSFEAYTSAADSVTIIEQSSVGAVDANEWVNVPVPITVTVYWDEAGLKYYE